MVPTEEDQDENLAVITPPVGSSPMDGPSPADSPSQQRRGKRKRKWGVSGVSDTIRRIRGKNPTRDEVMKTLPTFWPVMTVLIAVIEVGMIIATIATGGLAPIRFTPEINTSTVQGFGGLSEFASKEIVPNFFIGTSKSSLIHTGAMYTPVSLAQHNFSLGE